MIPRAVVPCALATVLLPGAAAARCALALVLALDVSGSIDPGEWRLQTGGLADAFRSKELQEAVLSLDGDLAVAVTQWTGTSRQQTTLPWQRLGSAGDIEKFSKELETMPRRWRHFSTAIGEALRHAHQAGASAPECRRRVIDVSGDGVSNEGEPPAAARDAARAAGWTINGLAIAGADPPPAPHYRTQVIAGPGAFVEVADGFEDYPRAIKRKLLREIRGDAKVAAVSAGPAR